MKLIYKGKFDGNHASLPHGEHMKNAVRFREPDSPAVFARRVNLIAFAVAAVLFVILFLIGGRGAFSLFGCAAALAAMFPHELLHAICFRETVYLYTYFAKGILFVVGPEQMSKARFVCMSLLPNLAFGLIPFLIFLIAPELSFFGTLGALSIASGVGDYYNVFNALTQMPKGAKTYLYQFNSYWFMPEEA